ncbi:Asp-tRNA(Asn)/Glu-tRNA(Gln) amidotransferase subunit GatB [Planctomycetota bacterium]
MSDMEVKVIVGLEIHVQLNTQTKIFCACPLEFGGTANTRVCPVCLGLPGSLPVMNRQAYDKSVLAALALNCQVARFTKWDRKSYYYPDLPKNYQISQYDLPLGENGYIEIPLAHGQFKRIGIIRAHLEEDAGKNLHTTGNYSQVDLNRTGTPLLEIVTEPDMNTATEVRALAAELQRIVRFIGVSEADMQKGHMRFEPNINLAITRGGQTFKTPIAEIKNLNSFRAIERSVEYEIDRQAEIFRETGVTLEMGNKTTRGWDDDKQMTVLQREKEEAHDYRYFPEPDLVPVEIDDAWLAEIQGHLRELPLHRQARFQADFGLSDYDAGVLTADRATADFFDSAVEAGGDPKRVCNLVTQVGLKIANERAVDLGELGLDGVHVAQLAKMIDHGEVNASAGNTILTQMVETGKTPDMLAKELNLIQKSDAGELEELVDQVLAAHTKAVEDVKSGGKKNKKARGFLLGQVMQLTKGQANPQVVSQILDKKLG